MPTPPSPYLNAKDTIKAMSQRDDKVYQPKREAANGMTTTNKLSIDIDWRQSMILWMYEISEEFDLPDRLVEVVSHYIDAACCDDSDYYMVSDDWDYQLLCLTALSLAVKVYETSAFQMDTLLQFGEGDFEEIHIEDAEMKLLTALKWQLHPPTVCCFVGQYFQLFPDTVTPCAKLQIEIKVRILLRKLIPWEAFAHQRRPMLAYGCLLVVLTQDDECHQEDSVEANELDIFATRMEHITGMDDDHLDLMQLCHDILKIDGSSAECGNEESPIAEVPSRTLKSLDDGAEICACYGEVGESEHRESPRFVGGFADRPYHFHDDEGQAGEHSYY